jgi:redox-sensitive bicupin YhaK (pirin superfamily)
MASGSSMTGRPDPGQPRIEVRRGAERFATAEDGRVTRHSFSFGRHYDPSDVGLGMLVAHNDDLVQPGHGYPDHPHRDLEIVTWVLDGALRHRDSTGEGGLVTPGMVQRLSAGSGVVHTEVNDDPHRPVHFVQMWVRPDETGTPPAYAQHALPDLAGRGWTTLASGLPGDRELTAVPLGCRRAGLRVARLPAGTAVQLPLAPLLHLFVARGAADLEGQGPLGTGDAARLHRSGGQRVTAVGGAGAEVLLWELHP